MNVNNFREESDQDGRKEGNIINTRRLSYDNLEKEIEFLKQKRELK